MKSKTESRHQNTLTGIIEILQETRTFTSMTKDIRPKVDIMKVGGRHRNRKDRQLRSIPDEESSGFDFATPFLPIKNRRSE